MKVHKISYMLFFVLFTGLVMAGGCAMGPQLVPPSQLTAPQAILDNTGKYMCPYTTDNVLAEWTDKALNAKMGSALGGTIGSLAGQKALEQVPFIGGMLGKQVGEAVGRKIAIGAAGGEQFIRESSDISFNSIDDMAVYMYVKYSTSEHYNDALKATMEIYPELKNSYGTSLINASRNSRSQAGALGIGKRAQW